MRSTTPARVGLALDFAEMIRRRLESRRPRREKRVLTTWTPEEHARLTAAAGKLGVALATLVHELALSGLDQIEKVEKK